MEFKIDTKETYCVITPVTASINAKMTEELYKKCAETRQNGSTNIIIDLQHCQQADQEALPALVSLHEESYAEDHSLVYTGLNNSIINALKENETDLLINAAPTMHEAIDIISMEILERDLLGEE